ncbi:hypothetical protein RRG08_065366 [Elysia crispata]|uniref:Uncharacterized protein n=1 Tax=Elysia crispata TaxID=231223 RepID=A0AAE1DYV4_9GAST|nr:hypothetical protein RRG08_065366 [Elysia crispata]
MCTLHTVCFALARRPDPVLSSFLRWLYISSHARTFYAIMGFITRRLVALTYLSPRVYSLSSAYEIYRNQFPASARHIHKLGPDDQPWVHLGRITQYRRCTRYFRISSYIVILSLTHVTTLRDIYEKLNNICQKFMCCFPQDFGANKRACVCGGKKRVGLAQGSCQFCHCYTEERRANQSRTTFYRMTRHKQTVGFHTILWLRPPQADSGFSYYPLVEAATSRQWVFILSSG